MKRIEKLFEEFDKSCTSYDGACEHCKYLRRWSEPRQFWGAPCSEEMAECVVDAGELLECRRFLDWLEEEIDGGGGK